MLTGKTSKDDGAADDNDSQAGISAVFCDVVEAMLHQSIESEGGRLLTSKAAKDDGADDHDDEGSRFDGLHALVALLIDLRQVHCQAVRDCPAQPHRPHDCLQVVRQWEPPACMCHASP